MRWVETAPVDHANAQAKHVNRQEGHAKEQGDHRKLQGDRQQGFKVFVDFHENTVVGHWSLVACPGAPWVGQTVKPLP
jgi:hypothetical protein